MTGIDPVVFERNKQFYRYADTDQLRGYRLAFRNPTGLVYVREDLWER